MKHNLICSLILASTLTFAVNCFGGDFATLNIIGFSKDGRYLAFEEYGTGDGSGFPYSNIYFIETAKNAYAAPRIAVRIENESASESSARKRSALLAAKKLRQLGIVRGNVGKLVVSHLMTDLTFEDEGGKPARVIKFAEEIGSMYRRGDHELSLAQITVKTKDCEAYEEEIKMLELKMTNKDADTSKFLQKDTALPATRGCPFDYRLEDVYIYKEFVAVFVGVFTRGFEGPDMRYMAVTGPLQ